MSARLPLALLSSLLVVTWGRVPATPSPDLVRAGEPPTVRLADAGGFALQSGPYTVRFGGGRLVATRAGAPGGLRLTLLAGDTQLDLLTHITSRQVIRQKSGMALVLTARIPDATAAITLSAYGAYPGLVRWTVALAPRGSGVPVDPEGTDLTYTNSTGTRAVEHHVVLYTGAEPSATAQTFLYDGALDSTLFYMSDLTALNGLFQQTGASPLRGTFSDPRGGPPALVGASARGVGFTFPPGSLSALRPGTPPTVIMDSYVLLAPGKPASEVAAARRFLDALADVYSMTVHPPAVPADWRVLGARTARDLRGPDVAASLGGHTYLRAYVSDRRVAPELITQLNVLVGTLAYSRTFGAAGAVGQLRRMLTGGLGSFYSPEYGSVVNNLPLPHGPGGGSESWYYIGDLINLARVAEAGDAMARSLLLRSVEGAIALAHHVHYVFPIGIAYQGWQGKGGVQADVAGGYAYLMEQLYGLTRGPHYLAEARAGVEHLHGYGWYLAYETHMTALAAAACARLFALTGQRRYLDASLVPLANLFTSTWLWDCGYGSCAGGRYHTFFGLNPLPWSPYIAMMEQEEAWQALREYALVAGSSAPASIRTLVAEFCRYSLSTLAYTLPPVLPRGVAGPAPGEYAFVPRNRLDLYIPLEDLRAGGEPSGQIGQEIYGAGGPLVLGGLASLRLAPDLWVTSPYPVAPVAGANELRIRVAGTPAYTVTVQVSGPGVGRLRAVQAGAVPLTLRRGGGVVEFTARGGETYTLVGHLAGVGPAGARVQQAAAGAWWSVR